MDETRSCSICLEILDTSCATLDCGHKFHANCITEWFRSQHLSCPECRGMPEKCLSKKCAQVRFKELQKISRRKTAPKALVKAFKKYNKQKAQLKEKKAKRKRIREELKTLKKHPTIQEYLQKEKQARWQLDYKESLELQNQEYLIGCTDYDGVNIKAISEAPLILSQAIDFNGNTYAIL